MKCNSILFYILLILSACTKEKEKSDNNTSDQNEELIPNYSRFDIVSNNDLYTLNDSNIISKRHEEVSGIINGRKNPNLVYVHEDSGNNATLYAYDKKGVFKGNFSLTGINNKDWEDIAIGPGPLEGETYIYIADLGDNSAVRSSVLIYRFPEPKLSNEDLASDFQKNISNFEIINFQYPDGPRDAETLLIDAITKELIIVSKREPYVHVYSLPFPQKMNEMNEAIFHGKLPLKKIIAGDISPDNSQLLLKDEGAIYLWNINNEGPINTIFNNTPQKITYIPEVQGEAICWEGDGKGYFTISETDKRADPILYHYRLR